MEDFISNELFPLCEKKQISIFSVESCTGGKIADLITSIPGSSKYFLGSIVAYSNEIKEQELCIDKEVIDKFGPVSEVVAKQMAIAGIKKFQASFSVSTTGIAGPDGDNWTDEVGLVFIGISDKKLNTKVYKVHFIGNRKDIKLRASIFAIKILYRNIKNHFIQNKDF